VPLVHVNYRSRTASMLKLDLVRFLVLHQRGWRRAKVSRVVSFNFELLLTFRYSLSDNGGRSTNVPLFRGLAIDR
jgi:hypothetical protein